MCAASGAADTAAACDSDWQQPKARRRQPRNSSSPCGRATSSFRNHTAAKTLRDRQVEIAAESDAFNQLPTVEQQRRIHTVVDTVRQLLPTVTSSPLFTALRDCLTERIVLQAEQSSDSPTDVPLYDVDLVCYGIGRFSSSLPSRLQLAVLLALRSSLPLSTACSLLLYDPLLSSLEQAVLRSLGLRVIEHNEEAKRCVSRCSVFYMPHCGQALYNNLLWANWAWRHRSGENKEVQLCQPAGLHIDGEQRQKEEVLTEGDGGLSTALSSVHLSSARHSAHLGRVILIGNQLSTYIDRRSFPSGSLTASSRNNSRRSAQRLSSLSTRCPIHSSVPSNTLSTPSIDCQYDCVCLVHELRLLQCRTFDGELGQSSEEMRLAFHDTAVQWFDWSEVDAAGEAERRRVEQWLQQRLAEPKRLADDGELVSSAERDPGS